MRKVLLVYQKLIPSAVLCGHVQLNRLAGQGKVEYRHSEAYHVTTKLLSWADTVIFVRGALEMDLLVAKAAKKAGKTLIYALDDDLFHVPAHIDSASFYNNKKIQSHMREIMGLCDMLLTPSETLLEKYGGAFEQSFLIEEPALHHKVFRVESPVTKICFAGSLDRTQDIEILLSDVIRRLISNFGNKISVTFFGAKPAIVDELGLEYIEYQNSYDDYIAEMTKRGFDIGLAPMVETEFSRCKHYNKFIEYASFGMVGVYSDVIPYTRAVRNGENGLLCSNQAEDWYQAVVSLVEQPELLKRLKSNCTAEAEGKYSLETVSELYFDAVNAAPVGDNTRHVRGYGFRHCFYIAKYFVARCLSFGKRTLKKILGIK